MSTLHSQPLRKLPEEKELSLEVKVLSLFLFSLFLLPFILSVSGVHNAFMDSSLPDLLEK